MDTPEPLPLYKTLPFLLLTSVLLIGGLITGNEWQQARQRRLEEERASSSALVESLPKTQFAYIASDMPELPDGLHYQLWGGSEELKSMLLEFEIMNGEAQSLEGDEWDTFAFSDKDISILELHVFSEEKNKSIPLLSGEMQDGTAALSLLPKVVDVSGSFILSTPTTATTFDETNGIHFVASNTLLPALYLPQLQEEWRYLAVVENAETERTYPLGTFSDPAQPDDYSLLSGESEGYGAPGEDFFCIERLSTDIPASCTGLDLADGGFVVEVGLTSSFTDQVILLPLLSADIPEGIEPNVDVEMKNLLVNEPSLLLEKK